MSELKRTLGIIHPIPLLMRKPYGIENDKGHEQGTRQVLQSSKEGQCRPAEIRVGSMKVGGFNQGPDTQWVDYTGLLLSSELLFCS